MVDLWIQALTEASEDRVIAAALRRQVREVHDFFADVIRDGQARGVIVADRDPIAEAWLFVAGGLLTTMDNRLGGLLGDDLERVRTERRRWMLGTPLRLALGSPATAAEAGLRPAGGEERRGTRSRKGGFGRETRGFPPKKERAPAAAPGALPGQAGRRVGDPEFGSAAGRVARNLSPLARSPCTATWRRPRCKVRSLYEPRRGLSSSSVK